MDVLFIEGGRNGFAPSQCGSTLTVGELIDILTEYDEDMPVYINNDNGYTFGSITKDSIEESETEDYEQ